MPANMPAPVLYWNTNTAKVGNWAATFKAGGRTWSFASVQPRWRPDEAAWLQMKAAASGTPLEVTLTGHEAGHPDAIRARGAVQFSIAQEAVETPIFFRDVNLPFLEAVKDPSKIRWRFGSLGTGTLAPVVLANLPVCGNCHSFSRNGEYLAMDVDYANNKGSYVIARTAPEMNLTTSDIITWDDYRRDDGQETLGLLSQISPDGRYVLSTVKDLSIFMPKPDLAFSQLFFPILGVVGVYDRETKQFSALPGADDPEFVQSNPTWSPDGQWVLFARHTAVKLKHKPARGRLLLSSDEDEEMFRQTQDFRYDLYRIPFNHGKGGQAEPLRGAAQNGRSNYFPKYSPDGRWIVFCQSSNYMLLRPDSQLFILPAEGGEPRRMGCNLSRMNSWHSWSPDGRWLVFTSKAHSDYTQLYLARIDERGEARPPVWLEHMVPPSRVANIPEFVDLPPAFIHKINEQFLDDHSYVRAGNEFLRAREPDRAIEKYRLALTVNSNNATAHELVGQLLKGAAQRQEAMAHMQAVVRLKPDYPLGRFVLGCALASSGDLTNAILHLEAGARTLTNETDRPYDVVDQQHRLPEALHYKLGLALEQTGRPADGEKHYREALRLAPDYAAVRQNLGLLLLRSGRVAEAGEQFAKVIEALPNFGQAHNCLGIVYQRQNRKAEAMVCFEKAVQCEPRDWQAQLNLANARFADGKREQAVAGWREVLRLNPACEPAQRALRQAQE